MRPARRLPLLLLAVLAAFIVVQAARPTRADENKKNELKREIESLLSNTASELRDVPGDSSTSDLERTFGYADQIYDKARELKDHAEGDSDARRMADYYPDYARRYREAARYLKEMKGSHRKLDELPRKCEDTMKELASRLRAFTDSHDPRGVEEVPRLARELGKVGKDALEQAERTRYEQATFYDRVDDFSDSDGKWSDVRSNLHGAGRAILEHVQRQQEQMKRDDVCGNLAKEERNPRVEEAMRKLFEGKKGIEMLYESMDRQLTEMAGNLDGLVGDSNESDIQNAERKLDEVERSLEQLDRIKGNDGEAKRRVETWRNIVRAGREGMKHLRTLKEAQFRADKAPERCRETTEKLREHIRRALEAREEETPKNLQQDARALAEPVKAGLAKTDEQHPIMERALSDAQRFDPSEGRWRSVTEKHRASAIAIFEYWKKARETAHATCDELAKGQEHKEVVAALADLASTRGDAANHLKVLEADHRKWEEGIKELREWYKQDTKNVREMFCKLPESPGDSAEGDAYAAQLAQVADRMRDRLRPKWSQISSDAARLISRAEVLMGDKDKTVRPGAAIVAKAITGRMTGLQNLMNNELNGSNDPDVRAKMELGKTEHKRIQADSSKCETDEITIPGKSLRIDCVRVSSGTCYIVEIKPNNPDAQTQGRGQLDKYRRGMQAYFDDNKPRVDDAFRDKLQIFKRCIANGKISLDTELRVYDYCPPEGQLFNDFVIQ
ncbi:MAG: hypothetical protein HS111_17840 [Kofleriaceae bacterium]|nr:hypothetical protein [Kofleriaceae bacterium]MCL4224326.1 hypothetical protein [Myxococcales bacterium]